MPKEIDIAFYYEIWNEILKLKWYFYKFAGVNAEEAMQKTLMHTLLHFNADKGRLSAYIKKLAREIAKGDKREVLVDFLENTLSETDWDGKKKSPTVDVGKTDDFSNVVLENMSNDDELRKIDVSKLALEFMDKFVMLCDALIRKDTSTVYYPEIFIKSCLELSAKCNNFNELCLDIYMEYGDLMKWFLDLDNEEDKKIWKETDFSVLNTSYSKRLQFIDVKTGELVKDADVDKYKVKGKIGTDSKKKKVIKINYRKVWDYLCSLIDDSETNELKFVINDNYIVRTFGGSYSFLNAELYNIYDVVKMEMLTNLIYDTNGRIINIGSENFYLVCTDDMNKTRFKRKVHGYDVIFDYEDITDTIQ